MTIREAESTLTQQLQALYELEEAKQLMFMVLSYVTHLSRTHYLLHKDHVLSSKELAEAESIQQELLSGKPIQYILGEAEFYGLRIKVNPSVLIPRPETEELVDWMIRNHSEESGVKILDIGTGSGCIPIALKKHLPQAEVWAMDISEAALSVAKENAVINQTEIRFSHDNILNPTFSFQPSTFNIIISNPPYITLAEKEAMHQNVVDFEPHEALFVQNDDPLLFYRAIADFAINNLSSDGNLYFEINENFGQRVIQLLMDQGFENILLKQDLMGKDRMVKANKVY